ncbi:640_t:CDS:10 [Funneliformis mosseae]|uniref:DNA-directed RNA polymerase n=1 Tax=Funneliformis mosseae TaxID=27381 RepID=A0A9N9CYP0_FUNMO|nr:640_t:CDS:10 [Funneliformis mosseae]
MNYSEYTFENSSVNKDSQTVVNDDDTRSEALSGYQTDESLVTEYASAFEEDDDEADLTQEEYEVINETPMQAIRYSAFEDGQGNNGLFSTQYRFEFDKPSFTKPQFSEHECISSKCEFKLTFAIRSHIIINGFRYSIGTGNWGDANRAGRSSVSQVLNRFTYVSTISHLRRWANLRSNEKSSANVIRLSVYSSDILNEFINSCDFCQNINEIPFDNIEECVDPLFVVDQHLVLTSDTLSKLKLIAQEANQSLWEALVLERYIEYIDAEEGESTMICISPDELYESSLYNLRKLEGLRPRRKRRSVHERLINLPTYPNKWTHCETSKYDFGFPRNTYQSAMKASVTTKVMEYFQCYRSYYVLWRKLYLSTLLDQEKKWYRTLGLKRGNCEKLVDEGFVPFGIRVCGNDILIENVSTLLGQRNVYQNVSTLLRSTEHEIVDQINSQVVMVIKEPLKSIIVKRRCQHLIECLMRKVYDGEATALSEVTVESILRKLGSFGFHRRGLEVMYNDKIHSRGRGPVNILTRQPVEGRSREG